jgi:phosphatidylinositol glycan class B
MSNTIKQTIKEDKKLQILLLAGCLIQLVTCIIQVGFYHPDQHFQIIEFSSFQLHKASGASHVWEMTDYIRSSLQVYCFSAYSIVCNFIKIHDPFLQLTILRIILGGFMFALFNGMALYYFREGNRKVLYYVLLLLNLSWLFPYVRTLFSGEIMSSLFFFGAFFWYDVKRRNEEDNSQPFVIGFLFALAFFFRFQMAFAIIGFGLWMLLFERNFKKIFILVAGFILASGICIYLDCRFYHEWIFTPYRYFDANITKGVAASFGTSSFMLYIGVLVAVVATPPLSIALIWYGLKGCFKKYNHPLVLSVLVFIIGHCMVGHKEERFLFPVFNALPIIIGWGLDDFIEYYNSCKKWVRGLVKAMLVFSISLDLILLALFTITPYSQTVYFSSLIKKAFNNQDQTIYCLSRTPLETESRLPLVFYATGMNVTFKKILTNDSLRYLKHATYVATTFTQVQDNPLMMDSLGYQPVFYSSKMLWEINEYLDSKKINTINDIWVLYKKNN